MGRGCLLSSHGVLLVSQLSSSDESRATEVKIDPGPSVEESEMSLSAPQSEAAGGG